MSQPHYGSNMDRPTQGSVKRARERAMAGEVRPPRPPKNDVFGAESPPGNLSPPPRRHMPPPQFSQLDYAGSSAQLPPRPPPQPPLKAPNRPGRPRMSPGSEGKGGLIISRPTQAPPQWPLPPGSPLRVGNPEGYRHASGQPRQAPPRPQRPSQVPSMVDQSRPLEPTPSFLNPQSPQYEQRESMQSHYISTPATASSRLTSSSVGTIPDFPAPATTSRDSPNSPTAPPVPALAQRRSGTLGPPPTSRRGASSYYSITSNVSPIPEESLRSPGSYASSFAMPSNWNNTSQASTPNFVGDVYYDDTATVKSRDSYLDDSGDESKLVRSASIGKKGKASLVDTKPSSVIPAPLRPVPNPIQKSFNSGTAYVDASTSSSEQTLPHKLNTVSKDQETTESPMMNDAPPEVTNSEDAMPASRIPIVAQKSNLASSSSMKRPPKLDIDAVKKAEARGSLTSLPDLIKRATRLAAMIEGGKRPASRLDNLSDFLEKSDTNEMHDRHQSGLSDMLNAFPPPAQPPNHGRRSRGSWFRNTSWPLIPVRPEGAERADPKLQHEGAREPPAESPNRRVARKCCGLPPWAFILLIILFLCIIAVAIVIPLQFFVFKTLGNHEEPLSGLEKCQSDLTCQNGGTNVISQGSCSCICTNGFSGSDCSEAGSAACTTTNLSSLDPDSNINDVTIGRALPRLFADANANFSIPLSGTAVLAKINSEDLSCLTQNALVTFGGRSIRIGEANTEINDMGNDSDNAGDDEALELSDSVVVDTDAATQSLEAAAPTRTAEAVGRRSAATLTGSLFEPRSTESSSGNDTPSLAFNVTEAALDFARVAVLFILQEQSVNSASDAQTRLERFFNQASQSQPQVDPVTERDAQNVTVSGESSVDLVNYRIKIGDELVGNDV